MDIDNDAEGDRVLAQLDAQRAQQGTPRNVCQQTPCAANCGTAIIGDDPTIICDRCAKWRPEEQQRRMRWVR